MIAIIGASGGAGIPTIKHLVGRGVSLRALTSNETSAENLKKRGVEECVIGDFRKPEDVARALKDVSQVMQIPPRFKADEFDIAKCCIDAARAQGVEHYLLLSAFHPQMQKLAHHWAKLLAEEYLIESGLAFTIIQPSMFMQNLKIEWSRVVKDGVYSRPYSSDRKMSVIDTGDMGEAAANILTKPEFWGATYELCGPGPITHNEMEQIITEELGREVVTEHRALEDWEKWAREHGWTEFAVQTYKAMCTHYDAHGFPGGTTVVLKALLGREPTGYRTFIRNFIEQHGA